MALTNLYQILPKSFITHSDYHATLGEEFSLCEHGNIVFHWADYFETCDMIKYKLNHNQLLKDDFLKREEGIKRLTLIPVWIKTPSKVYQTTMYNLYESYLLNQNQSFELDPFGPIDISFISGTGPFKSMAITECFSQMTYQDFVLIFLLKERLPKRDFRVRLKSKVLVEYGNDLNEASLVSLEQITANGLLLSVESDSFLKGLSQSEGMRLLIDTNLLKESCGKTLPELKAHLSQYAFNFLYSAKKSDALSCSFSDFSVQSSFDFFKNKKVYLFVGYDKLSKNNPREVKVFESFVNHTKKIIQEYYQKEHSQKESA